MLFASAFSPDVSKLLEWPQNGNLEFPAKPLKSFGAGEGNRTLVFSLEALFLSII
jgi:hypothetical protein